MFVDDAFFEQWNEPRERDDMNAGNSQDDATLDGMSVTDSDDENRHEGSSTQEDATLDGSAPTGV